MKVEPNAEMTEPTIKSARAKIMICRVVNHFEINEDNGKIIPITNIYPVTNH